ncbi:D-alanyl-D-alanine carboxypeptidase [Nibricoccus aquaticus]|uniref:D-alanyl-D-alanine carboxypeptidase n=1 Tax=Nibricoccus aquaticus TaxID=2576891 RepID=A0A290QIA9_9BACT|nr:D-alanyl-D-alanine carboxypeptidase family protein [Nibricoccus aquaticus]ATC65068.1 D-alanyl-D-alanine carboxypeptidase [Nibricoccus aquaticus]
MFFARLARPFFLRLSLLIAICAAAPTAALAQTKSKPATGTAGIYKGYVVTDAATGKILLEDGANTVTPPASMTKIMTFLIVSDAIKAGTIALDTPVRITNEDAKMGGTGVWLDPRETFTVEELLLATMIQSANDAAHALSRAAAGSREAFVERMNARAQALGMTRTRFTSPHGLPPSSRQLADSDLTTPADFAILCREAITTTDILRYSAIKTQMFGTSSRPADKQIRMDNHNKLLGRVAGVDGLKTGYTKAAGYCLSATAERNGRRLIVVIMGSFGVGGQIDTGRSRDLKTIELIERGFSTLAAQSPAIPASPLAPPPPATPRTTSPVSAPSPVTESGPTRGNLTAPRRPDPSPITTPSDEKTAAPVDEPTVKFVPIAPPVPSKSKSR